MFFPSVFRRAIDPKKEWLFLGILLLKTGDLHEDGVGRRRQTNTSMVVPVSPFILVRYDQEKS
jgi:hypothetical protein